MEDKNEVVLTSVEQFKEYLKEHGDDKTIISIVLELADKEPREGGTDGKRACSCTLQRVLCG